MIAHLKAGPIAQYDKHSSPSLEWEPYGILQAFEKHIANFYKSDEFKEKAEAAQSFFKGIKDYVFGRPTTLENMVRISLWYQLRHSDCFALFCD